MSSKYTELQRKFDLILVLTEMHRNIKTILVLTKKQKRTEIFYAIDVLEFNKKSEPI